MSHVNLVALFAAGVFTLIAATIDFRTRRIPNWLTVPALIAGVLFHTITGGLSGLGNSLGGFAIGFAILLVLWLIGGGGGGDVKLMGALGAWLGVEGILWAFMLSTAIAAFATVALSATEALRTSTLPLGRKFATVPTGARAIEPTQPTRGRRMLPYAVPVALGTWVLLAGRMILH